MSVARASQLRLHGALSPEASERVDTARVNGDALRVELRDQHGTRIFLGRVSVVDLDQDVDLRIVCDATMVIQPESGDRVERKATSTLRELVKREPLANGRPPIPRAEIEKRDAKIRELRAQGMTQAEIGLRVGISQTHVGKILRRSES